MKLKFLLSSICILFILSTLTAQDVIVIEGGTGNEGLLEATINGDTTDTGERKNPNRIYELKSGAFYIQRGPINVENPNGAITIQGKEGESKPVIIKQPLEEVNIGTNQINSSLTIKNVQYHAMETDASIPWSCFNITGDNHKLWIEDCFFENANGPLFGMNNVLQGAKIIIRNSYFRDMHDFQQWWNARIVQAKVPLDTLIFENNTVTGAGLMILAQESLIDFAIINHNTIINNHKYPFLNQYWKEVYLTNNLFVNSNMVGEDLENVATGGQDPDALLHGISGVDTIENSIFIQPKYLDSDSNLTSEVDELSDIIYYAADNVVTYSSVLDNYYNGGHNNIYDDAPVSYLTWGGADGPFKVRNVPGMWANERTLDLIADHDNINDENNSIYEMSTADLGLETKPLPQEAADVFIQWNRNEWGVPDAETPTDFSPYYFGDYDPNTIPGVETENAPAGTGGITKISDMVEDFSYTADLMSKSDGLPIGALHWNDQKYDYDGSLASIKSVYGGGDIIPVNVISLTTVKSKKIIDYSLANYPNPFNAKTTIGFTLPENTHVNLTIYDISGKQIATLINENKITGKHTVEFVPDEKMNGIYFCKLSTKKGVSVKKLTLIK